MEIETAMTKASGHCMVAQAIKRTFPDVMNVLVDFQTIRFSDKRKGVRYTYLTPANVMAILLAWDQGIKPKPFSFKLRDANISSMRMREKLRGKSKRVHKFGKKKLAPQKRSDKPRTVIGGSPPPVLPSGKNRIFGSHNLNHLLTNEELQRIQAFATK